MKIAAREHLKKMFDERGTLTVKDVVDEARKKSSPLHSEFEWDKGRAHEIYLMDRAREMIRELYIQEVAPGVEESIRVREYQSLPVPGAGVGEPRMYVPTSVAISNTAYRTQVLEQALAELSSFKRKYANLVALAPVIAAIDKVTKRRKTKSAKAEQPAA